MYLRIGDVESTIPLWCQSIHLLFRIMPITSLRVLRCMYRLLWVIGAGDDTTSTHIPGIIPVDRVFAMTVHDYQTGAPCSHLSIHSCDIRILFVDVQGTMRTPLV